MTLSKAIIISLVLAVHSFAFGLDTSCIKNKVVGGDTCNTLRVEFDFSACGASAPKSRTVRSTCVNQKAVGFVKSSESVFIATYGAPVQEGGEWRYLSIREDKRQKKAEGAVAPTVGVIAETAVPISKKADEPVPALEPTVELKPTPPVPVVTAAAKADDDDEDDDEVDTKAVSTLPAIAAPAVSEKLVLHETKTEAHDDLAHGMLPGGLQFSGFVDLYYQYDSNNPPVVTVPSTTSTTATNPPTGNVPYRFFDNYHDTFSVSMAELTLKKETKKVGAMIDLGFGNTPTIMSLNDEATKNVLRAVMYYKPTDNTEIRFGKMYSHLGVEEPYATENMNYSRSLLFTYAIPLWNTGLEIDVGLWPKNLIATFFVYNNNGNTPYENKQTKTVGGALAYRTANFEISYAFQSGSSTQVYNYLQQIHDANIKWDLSPDVTLQIDGMSGLQQQALYGNAANATWSAGWIGVAWQPGNFIISPRFEMYSDPQGFTINGGYGSVATANGSYISQNINSATLTTGYEVGEGARILLEARQDTSDQYVFYNYNGTTPSSSTSPNSQTQNTYTLAFLYEL